MDDIIKYVTENQFTVAVAAFLCFLVLYLIFKRLIKFALFLALLLILMVGYMYFKDPKTAPGDLKETVEMVRDKTEKVVDKSKDLYDKGKSFVEKGQKMTKEAEKLIEDKKQ